MLAWGESECGNSEDDGVLSCPGTQVCSQQGTKASSVSTQSSFQATRHRKQMRSLLRVTSLLASLTGFRRRCMALPWIFCHGPVRGSKHPFQRRNLAWPTCMPRAMSKLSLSLHLPADPEERWTSALGLPFSRLLKQVFVTLCSISEAWVSLGPSPCADLPRGLQRLGAPVA